MHQEEEAASVLVVEVAVEDLVSRPEAEGVHEVALLVVAVNSHSPRYPSIMGFGVSGLLCKVLWLSKLRLRVSIPLNWKSFAPKRSTESKDTFVYETHLHSPLALPHMLEEEESRALSN